MVYFPATHPPAREVVASSKNGFPWQACIGAGADEVQFTKPDSVALVNGQCITPERFRLRSIPCRLSEQIIKLHGQVPDVWITQNRFMISSNFVDDDILCDLLPAQIMLLDS